MLATFDIGTMMSQENQIKEIPLDMLNHTYNHQFTMYDDEKRSDMTESIRKHGCLLYTSSLSPYSERLILLFGQNEIWQQIISYLSVCTTHLFK